MNEINVVADGGNWTGPPLVSGSIGMEQASGDQNDPEESTPIMDIDEIDDTKEYDEEAVSIPESSHSFLFTEPVNSIPFLFGVGITCISYACLALALINNVKCSVPANVNLEVRIAQYLSIFIALLMEEEIPTGLYLLRRITQPYLKNQCPQVSYCRFVGSCVLRITMGYFFLANVIVILILAEDVIAIFYDVLALQFIQQLDDIGYSLCKMDVLGKRMHRATLTPLFNTEFQKQKESLGLKWRIRIALKGAYFINLAFFLAVMVIVSVRQDLGYYQSKSIKVRFADAVWDGAIVKRPEGQEEEVLLYSWFDGVYVQDGDKTNKGRPIYIEQKKSSHTPFDKDGPIHPDWGQLDAVAPAIIMYCNGRWIFTHEQITKSSHDDGHETECNWLARSQETPGFDLLEVSGSWQLWVGAIEQSDVLISDNECQDDDDCNLNGMCNKNTGECDCLEEEGVSYFGLHCEVKVKDDCRTIIDESSGSEWTMDVEHTWANTNDVFQTYSRPAFSYVKQDLSDGDGQDLGDDDELALVYSGARWFMIVLEGSRDESLANLWGWQTSNYHAFWSGVLRPGQRRTFAVSDVTTMPTPVGSEFFSIGNIGSQFLPLGMELISNGQPYRCKTGLESCIFCSDGLGVEYDFIIPGAPTNVTCGIVRDGIGYYKQDSKECEETMPAEQICCPNIEHKTGLESCTFCSNGLSVEYDFIVPGAPNNETCGVLRDYIGYYKQDSKECEETLLAEPICCPNIEQALEMNIDNALASAVNNTVAIGPCSFCLSGLGVEADTVIPGGDGSTCGEVHDYSKTLEEGSEMCQLVQPAEPLCCGP